MKNLLRILGAKIWSWAKAHKKELAWAGAGFALGVWLF